MHHSFLPHFRYSITALLITQIHMVALKISETNLGNYFWNNKQLWTYFEMISRQCWIIIPKEPLCLFVFLPWHWRKVPSHCNIIIYLILSFRPLLLVCLWEHKEQTANQKSPSWNEIDSVGAEQSVINTVGRAKDQRNAFFLEIAPWALLPFVCTSRC